MAVAKLYMGSSIKLAIRTCAHISNKNSNVYLENAFKHGLNNLTLVILERLPEAITNKPLDVKPEHSNGLN